MTRYTVHFTGRVQGVGFRWTTTRLARNHVVAGYVQNLSDGRVRLVVEGKKKELNALVAAIRKQFADNLTDCTIDESAPNGEFGDPAPGGVTIAH